MTFVRGLVCRECGRGVPQGPLHVCEHRVGPLEVDYEHVEPDEPVVGCITGSRLETVDPLAPRLPAPLRVGASLASVEAVLPARQPTTTR